MADNDMLLELILQLSALRYAAKTEQDALSRQDMLTNANRIAYTSSICSYAIAIDLLSAHLKDWQDRTMEPRQVEDEMHDYQLRKMLRFDKNSPPEIIIVDHKVYRTAESYRQGEPSTVKTGEPA